MSQPEASFYSLGIAPSILNLLDKLKFTVPTQIQLQAIPLGIEGKDMMGIAQTGTGKTLAFGIPMVQRLAQIKGRGLILVPTRELAIQVDESLRKITPALGIKTAVLIGGDSMGRQIQSLRLNPRIIIATPGRLIDHLQQKTLRLNDAHIVVLDEADRMLDMGFAPQIKDVLRQVPADRQTMLFSATMPTEVLAIAKTYMKLPVQIEITRAGSTVDKITQELFIVRKELKNDLLGSILTQYHGPILVFSRTKFGAARLVKSIRGMRSTAAEIHSDRSLGQRKEALEGFKSGKYRVLVATDIASRGIDVKGIEVVINYDLPDDPDNYVHRIGRTGRAGHKGHAISFATPDQRGDVMSIERVMNLKLPVAQSHPTVSLEQFSRAHVTSSSKFGGGRGGNRRTSSHRPSSSSRNTSHGPSRSSSHSSRGNSSHSSSSSSGPRRSGNTHSSSSHSSSSGARRSR